MEQHKISVCDRIPPLSPIYPRFVAQKLEDDEGDEVGDHIFYTIHKQALYHHRCRIPELIGRQIRACFHGWVILSKFLRQHDLIMWSLWNPLTSKLIHLPPLQGDFQECCLSSPPNDPSSIFLLTTDDKPTIAFCRLEHCKRRWTEMSYAKQLRNIIDEYSILSFLTCYNGKVYALHSGDECDFFVIHVDIVVKEKEVVIRLLPFVEVPNPSYINKSPSFNRRPSFITAHFLKGSCSELFYVEVGFEDETREIVSDVYLFKLDMTSMTWEELEDLKDAIFFIELACDYSIFYTSAITSELGGYIHILDTMGKLIYSYNIKDRKISPVSMSSLVRTSHVSSLAMLECRLQGDHEEAEYTADSKQEEEDKYKRIAVTGDEVELNIIMLDESHLLNITFHVLEMIMEFCVGVEYTSTFVLHANVVV